MRENRIQYIDNVRIFLISLVVLHHLAITYGAPGGWYYREGQAGAIATIVLSLFVATNQSFFMGLLFFISAYFTRDSLNSKGVKFFLTKRLIRLGIPLLFYFFVLSPIAIYLPILYNQTLNISFWEFYKSEKGFGFGPLWFIEVLLLFSLFYSLFRLFAQSFFKDAYPLREMPNTSKIVKFIFLIGLITFTLRIWLPVGWTLDPFNFQLAHYPQYISLLLLGILAHKNHWLDSFRPANSLRWLLFAQIMMFVFFPLIFYFGGAATGDIDKFMGGLHIQSFMYSLWEQFTGIALMIGILGLFKYKLNWQGTLGQLLSRSTYAVFIIHPPVLLLICLNLKTFEIPLFLKFIILAIPVLACCFILAYFIRKIPFVKNVV
ncbi:MAG: acyltransferase [Gammaproteobacteria bacterium]|nr:acyltransferase [Gammaproteobacteria bacterium]